MSRCNVGSGTESSRLLLSCCCLSSSEPLIVDRAGCLEKETRNQKRSEPKSDRKQHPATMMIWQCCLPGQQSKPKLRWTPRQGQTLRRVTSLVNKIRTARSLRPSGENDAINKSSHSSYSKHSHPARIPSRWMRLRNKKLIEPKSHQKEHPTTMT